MGKKVSRRNTGVGSLNITSMMDMMTMMAMTTMIGAITTTTTPPITTTPTTTAPQPTTPRRRTTTPAMTSTAMALTGAAGLLSTAELARAAESTYDKRFSKEAKHTFKMGASGFNARNLLIERAGFPAVYASGGAISRSTGIPDLGLMSMSEITERLATMVDAVDIPVVASGGVGEDHPTVGSYPGNQPLVDGGGSSNGGANAASDAGACCRHSADVGADR